MKSFHTLQFPCIFPMQFCHSSNAMHPHRQDELITPSPLVVVVFALTMSEHVLHQRLLGALLFDCETERKRCINSEVPISVTERIPCPSSSLDTPNLLLLEML
jgi:hypothetical protein